jgi:hypothetical protein
MLPPDRILLAARGHPDLAAEALLIVRAERQLTEVKVKERTFAIFERKVLLAMTVVAFLATIVFGAFAMLGGAIGSAAAAISSGGALVGRHALDAKTRSAGDLKA